MVFALRNQEGGAHFDEELRDQDYAQMAHGTMWMSVWNGEERPMRELELATMRQVAWELLESFRLAGLLAAENIG